MEPTGEVPITGWTQEQTEANWKGNTLLAQTAARDIKELSQVIDFLIDNLPGITTSDTEQVSASMN
jgi:hypothetical protein